MPTPGICALCQRQSLLQGSHIIPKFVANWIKETSATPYLRQAVKPNVRRQDITTFDLLCADCEQLFSGWGREFANQVFRPYQDQHQQVFVYDEWLLRFAVSLAWRTAVVGLEGLNKEQPQLVPALEQAINCWREFLVNADADPGPYEHHLFLLDGIAEATGIKVPRKFHWYCLRGVDSTTPASSKEVYSYTKIPGMIFWSGVQPAAPPGWHNTRIQQSGTFGAPGTVEQPGFLEFLFDRVNLTATLMDGLSEKQNKRISEYVRQNPERFATSRSLEALLADREWRERQKDETDT